MSYVSLAAKQLSQLNLLPMVLIVCLWMSARHLSSGGFALDKTGASDFFSAQKITMMRLKNYYSDYLNAQGLQDSYQKTKEQIWAPAGHQRPRCLSGIFSSWLFR